MRSEAEVDLVLELAAADFNPTEIAAITGISRGTVKDWVAGRIPRKAHLDIVLTDWQWDAVRGAPEKLLRGLIHSDGCRFMNTGTNWRNPRYSFSNQSSDIRSIFIAACKCLGLHTTQAPHTVYVSRKADVAELDRHVGPKH